MVFVETILKKIGFDCMGLQNDSNINDKILSFGPALIISDAFGRKVNGLQLSMKLKRVRGYPKVVLILNPKEEISDDDKDRLQVDGLIKRPVHPLSLIETICTLLQIDEKTLKKKLEKLGLFQEEQKDKLNIISGKNNDSGTAEHETYVHLKSSSLSDKERAQKFQAALDELPKTKIDGIKRKQVLEQVAEFRNRESDPEIQDIDKERFAFVKALFKK